MHYDLQSPILDWIYAGPFEKDVSELYQDNYIVPTKPYKELLQEAQEGFERTDGCREGDELSLFGQRESFRLYRIEEGVKQVTWARFGTFARLLVTYARTDLIVGEGGMPSFRLWATGSVFVRVNGATCFQSIRLGRVSGEYEFQAPLRPGKNSVSVMLFNVHLHCLNSFSLSLASKCEAKLPLMDTFAPREQIEGMLRGFYLEKPLLSKGEHPLIRCDGGFSFPDALTWFVCEQEAKDQTHSPMGGDGRLLPDAGSAYRMDGDIGALAPGKYKLFIRYIDRSGVEIESEPLFFECITQIPDVPDGLDAYARRQFLMTCCAAKTGREDRSLRAVYRQLARLLSDMGEAFDESEVRRAIDYVNARYDCADFAMHGLLRLYLRVRGTGRISKELESDLKRCILGFKYWVDEPGKSMMFTRSENHELLFFSAEYIAGLACPLDVFENSGQNGLFHALKGRLAAERWIKEKGRWGFTEWHSNTYYEEDILALLSLYDFGEENAPVCQLAKNLLDLISLLIACHSYHGIMATTHGRCYEETLLYPETEAMGSLNFLLIGSPRRLLDNLSIGAVALCDSGYTAPRLAEELACGTQTLLTRTRMGLFRSKGLGGVNCLTCRTKDYMLSGLVESNFGEHGGQVSTGQALLDGKVPVFVTCFDNRSATTRPSYWGGQYLMPKMETGPTTLASIYKIPTAVGFTHCYFPFAQFDETLQAGKWLFGRKGDAYIGVYSQKPYEIVQTGAYRQRELLCLSKENIWILEVGNREQYKSFGLFRQKVLDALLKTEGDTLVYHVPSGEIMRLGWDEPCKAEAFPLIENNFLYGKYGEGIVSYKKEAFALNFNF